MKLPTFQAQKGTSMGSAMTSPARVGQIKQRVAVTKPLVGVRNVQGELSVGLQKSRTALMVGKAVSDLATMTIRTMEANDTLEQEAAASEFSNRSAATAIELKRDANVLNEDTGKFGYETFEDDMKRHDDALESELREKYNWSSKRSEYRFRSTVAGSKVTNSRALNTYANAKYAEKNKALFNVSLAGANTAEKANQIIAEGVKTGTIFDFQVPEITKAWQAGATYDQKTQQIPQMGMDDLLKFRDRLDANDGEIDAMNTTQKSALNTQIQRQIMNTHLATMTTIGKKGGTRAMGKYVEALRNTGVSATGARDETGSEKILQSLGAVYKRQVLRDSQNQKAQESTAGADTFYSPLGNPVDVNARRIAIQEDSGVRKDIDLQSRELAASEGFFRSEPVQAAFNRGIELGYLPDPYTIRLEGEIGSGNIAAAVEFYEYTQARAPGLIKLNEPATKKMEFYRGQKWMGIEHEEILKNYSKVENRTTPEQTLADEKARSSLANMSSFPTTFTKAVSDFAPDDERFEKGGIFYGTSMTDDVQLELQSLYLGFRGMVEDDNAALKLTYDAYTSTHDLNKLYETPTFERYPPSFMTIKPEGMSDDEFETSLLKQHQEQLDFLNEHKADNSEELTTGNTKLRYTDDPNSKRWLVVNQYGQAIPHPVPNGDGSISPVQFKYSGFSNTENTKIMRQTNDANFLGNANQMDALVAERNRSVDLTNREDVKDDPIVETNVYGFDDQQNRKQDWDYRSVTTTRDYMEKKWAKMSDSERDNANLAWYDKQEMLYGVLQAEGVLDEARADLMINRYLFMKGYMRSTLEDELMLPPGATRKYVVPKKKKEPK